MRKELRPAEKVCDGGEVAGWGLDSQGQLEAEGKERLGGAERGKGKEAQGHRVGGE